jgi:hypothetical protein
MLTDKERPILSAVIKGSGQIIAGMSVVADFPGSCIYAWTGQNNESCGWGFHS